MRKFLIGVVVLLLLCSVVTAAPVDDEVLETLQEEEEVEVIVVLKEEMVHETLGTLNDADHKEVLLNSQQEVLENLNLKEDKNNKEFDIELHHQYSIVNGFSGSVTEEGLEKLQEDPRVEHIYFNRVLETTLDGSIPNINANDVWNLSVGGYNITGDLETVCIIDTGIDTDHAGFTGRIKAQHCYCRVKDLGSGGCCPDETTEDISAEDDQGHGTHVAGIAAGNYTAYRGVAPGAGIVSVKVCDNSASALCNTDDVIAGIQWCTNNATTFNISVISVSLGGGGPYNSYCNSDSIASSINTAVGKNISVIVASGNNGFTNGISTPACIQNATAVGAVSDSDAISYNRGDILDLLAPGISITSTYNNGATTSQSGTSMATPHVSGAAILLKQYWRLAYGETLTPSTLQRKLRITGAIIDDTGSSGNYYPRIDVLRAIQPFINFTANNVANNSITPQNYSSMNISSDVNLTSSLVEVRYGNGSVINHSMIKQNGTNYVLNITHLVDGTHTYLAHGNDTANTGGQSVIRTLIVDSTLPAVTITAPTNGSVVGGGTLAFNATVNEVNSDTVIFMFTNATGNKFNLTTTNVSGNWNNNLDLTRLVDGLHTMTVFANDSAGNVNQTVTVQFTRDVAAPSVNFSAPATNSNYTLTSGNVTFNSTIRDSQTVDAVLFSFTNASGNVFNLTATNQSGYWIVQYNVSSLIEGSTIVTIYANDTLGNLNNTQSITIFHDNAPPAVNFSNPTSGSTYTFASSNQTFNATVSDSNLSVEKVVFSFDNATGTGFNVTAVQSGTFWTAQYNVSTLAEGTHSVRVFANDTLGNMNHTININISVDITTPISTLNRPASGLENNSALVTFDCSTSDNTDLANLTLYGNWSNGWHGNQTTNISGTTNSSIFSKSLLDGHYRWNCFTSDTDSNRAFSGSNRTFIIDTARPQISSVSSGTPGSTSATITWTTNEASNSTVEYGTEATLGTFSTSTSLATNHDRTLSSLTAARVYYFNVTSCDNAGNCNTTGPNQFTTAAASSSSSSSSSGGGGGGGGGSSVSSSSDKTTTESSDASGSSGIGGSIGSSSSSSGGSAVEGEESVAPEPAPKPVVHTTTVSLVEEEDLVVEIGSAEISVTKVRINSKVSKDTVLQVSYLPEKPFMVTELREPYQYLEININLTEDEISGAIVVFEVPKSWLVEHNFLQETVLLETFVKDHWESLPTKLAQEMGEILIFEAELEHFSYFAITAKTEVELSWFRNLIPPKLGTKGFVLFGLLILIAFMLIVYWLVSRKRREEY